MKKNILIVLSLGLLLSTVFASGKKDAVSANAKVIASTTWTAAFADIAGVDDVTPLAPADMKHPPEYELTVSDIKKLPKANISSMQGTSA